MRRVYEAPREAAARGERAREDILTKHDAESSGKAVARRLDEIRSRGRATVSVPNASSGDGPPGDGSPEAHLLAQLERAAALATPTTSVGEGRGFRQPLLFLQSLLFRVLRPYWFQQRQSQELLIQTLREVMLLSAARSAVVEPRQRQALESIWEKVHAIEREIVAHDVPVAKTFETIRADIGSVRSDVDALCESVSSFQGSAADHLKALTDGFVEYRTGLGAHIEAAGARAETAVSQTNELAARLYAAPYMNGPERFHYTDNGKRILGFRIGTRHRRRTVSRLRGHLPRHRGLHPRPHDGVSAAS